MNESICKNGSLLRKFYDDLLKELGSRIGDYGGTNEEIALNFILVTCGARTATLLEVIHRNIQDATKIVEVLKKKLES